MTWRIATLPKDPINKDMLREIYRNQQEGLVADEEEVTEARSALGEAGFIAQTTHPILAPACSIISSIVGQRTKGITKLTKHLWRYIKGVQHRCLKKQNGNREGLMLSSDADWAGLYSVNKEKRSRTGILATYDGMPFAWRSSYQKCKGTEFNET